MSKQYPKTKAELFRAYDQLQGEVPYIAKGDVHLLAKERLEEIQEQVKSGKLKHKGFSRGNLFSRPDSRDYLAYE